MNEAQLTREFHTFIKTHPRQDTEVYEFKMIKADSFNPKLVKDHQVKGLLDALEGLWFKIPDTAAINGFSAQKPFDAIYIKAKRAYVIPIFYLERKYKEAILIPVKDFLNINKSIKRQALEKMGFITFFL